eukprot:55941-Eustigmatos_ZCMA.PRE.1
MCRRGVWSDRPTLSRPLLTRQKNAPSVRPSPPDSEEKSPTRNRASALELDVCSLPRYGPNTPKQQYTETACLVGSWKT